MKKRILSMALALVLAVSLLPAVPAQAAGSATGQQIVNCAMQYLDKVPYVWGGKTIDGKNPGADCSGFICRIYEKFGFDFWDNRTTLRKEGTNLGTNLSVAQLGDIIWFDGHVAIYAGKSGGYHMIVHETGGSYQNVAYTKVDVVRAELKGIIRIPGITNSGSSNSNSGSTTVTKPNVTMTTTNDSSYKSKEKITNTNAVVVNKIVKPSGVSCTKMGVILYDASGSQIKKHSENVSNVGKSTTTYHSWFDINSELGVTLTPGTTYKYRFFGVFNGTEVLSSNTYSFTTTGTAPSYYLDLNGYLDGTNVNKLEGYGTADVYINGKLVANDCVDYYTKWPTGTKYEIKDIKATSGHTYGGVRVGSLSGTIGSSDVNVRLTFTTAAVTAPESVTIVYIQDGSTVMTQEAKVGDYYESSHFEKDGYTFKGWYSSATGGTKYDGTAITTTSPRTLYAQYELEAVATPQQYTVYLYSNGAIYKTLTVTNGQKYGTLPTPSLSGSTFDGWYTKVTGGTKVTSSTTVNLTADQTLYARFSAVQQSGGTITLQIGNPKMTVSGASKSIDEQGTVPVIRNSRTLLPVRAVFEAMGGTVGWDNANRVVTLTKDGKTLYLGINNTMSWDSKGKYYTLDSAPVILNSRTMLPIRFVVEYFGGDVAWNGTSQTVTITY